MINKDRFIEIHVDGERRLINADWVEEIREDSDGKCQIYFAFSCPNCDDQDVTTPDERYEEIEAKFWR